MERCGNPHSSIRPRMRCLPRILLVLVTTPGRRAEPPARGAYAVHTHGPGSSPLSRNCGRRWVEDDRKQAERPMDSGIPRREDRRRVAPMGREPFELVGAGQALARQTAPTAFAHRDQLTALSFAAG
jgi:hypothetical protein